MGKPTGFLEVKRALPQKRPVEERVNDSKEIYKEHSDALTQRQASRCMDCGVPFCHKGCPLGNNIPEFNDAVYQQDWELAYNILNTTNNFPEFTGRICPAPCESACVLAINKPAIAIEFIENSIAEKAFELGFITLEKPTQKTGKKIAVVGSGPAGLAASDQLNKAGHEVTLFERADKIGGLLRYGIPDFKLEKTVLDRRLEVMGKSGVSFKTNTNVGIDISAKALQKDFDAVLLTGGSTVPRDLPISGREAKGIHFAMDFLKQQNQRVSGYDIPNKEAILATDKDVVVIGGGDTGSDCIGTSNRHKAKSITQLEIMDKMPNKRALNNPWPEYARTFKMTTSHEEGADRYWLVSTKEFLKDEKGNLRAITVINLENKDGKLVDVEGSEREIPCQLALLAIGFVHPQHEGLLHDLGVELTDRGNVADKNYQTNIKNVFTAGDMRRGQSLVVWAISEGREAARQVDLFLMGESALPTKDRSGVLAVNQ